MTATTGRNRDGRAETVILLAFLLALVSAPVARADDAAIKKQLIGRWETPGGVTELKADGSMLQLGFPGPQKWDVRNGVFYDHRDSFKILSLTKTRSRIRHTVVALVHGRGLGESLNRDKGIDPGRTARFNPGKQRSANPSCVGSA